MTSTQLHPRHGPRWSSGFASLIPWAGFLVASVLADIWVDYKSISVVGLVATAPLALVFVALPSALPLAAARRSRSLWFAVLFVMTGVATIAGALVVTTDDAQAGLAALWVPFVAIPLAGVIWIGQTIVERWSGARRAAGLSARLAALAIDVVIVGAALVVPLTAMSHANQEVAAGAVGVAVATIYLAALVSVRGGSIGHTLWLAVVDASTGNRLPLPRALLRSLILVVEVSLAPTLILSPIAFAELWSASATGRSLTDRLLRTEVVSTLLGGEDSNPQ